jgi:predicted amidohydrolase
MDTGEPNSIDDIVAASQVDEFVVTERMFSQQLELLSVGLANIGAVVPDIEANKERILRALDVFRVRGVNLAILPELCLSGYFWEDEGACRTYMEGALIENHLDWIERELRPLLSADGLRAVALNTLRAGDDGRWRNSTFMISEDNDYLAPQNSYDKVFLPGIEKRFTVGGRDDRTVASGEFGTIGFTTCYDYLFSDLLREYSVIDDVDAIIEVASWRSAARRDYPGMNVKTDQYYGKLWDMTIAAGSATNQVWTIACNAVGRHPISGVPFWGGSGIWAPSGLPLVQASNVNDELIIVHNLDLRGERRFERDDFNYAFDFDAVYRPMTGVRAVTRALEEPEPELPL